MVKCFVKDELHQRKEGRIWEVGGRRRGGKKRGEGKGGAEEEMFMKEGRKKAGKERGEGRRR